MRICAVIPAFNEEAHIANVVRGVKSIPLVERVYVIDDGSRDNTSRIAAAAGATVICHPVNMGVGAGLREGFKRALQDGMEIIVVMGGDDQDIPSEIPRLVDPIVNHGFDLVQGSRWLKGGDVIDIPLFRRLTTKAYALFIRLFTGFPFTDGTNGFRAIRASILKNINLDQDWLNTYELEPYLLCQAVKLKHKVTEAPVTKRYFIEKGYTKMIPLLDWWRISRPVLFLKLGIKK